MKKSPFHVVKGRLHKALGIPEGQSIPPGKLIEASRSKDPHMRKMVNFAMNAKKFNHKKRVTKKSAFPTPKMPKPSMKTTIPKIPIPKVGGIKMALKKSKMSYKGKKGKKTMKYKELPKPHAADCTCASCSGSSKKKALQK